MTSSLLVSTLENMFIEGWGSGEVIGEGGFSSLTKVILFRSDRICFVVQMTEGYFCVNFAASKRGKGARVKGNFHLKRGAVLKILVGQEGGVNTISGGAGGGGGTFVVTDENTPLLIGESEEISYTLFKTRTLKSPSSLVT